MRKLYLTLLPTLLFITISFGQNQVAHETRAQKPLLLNSFSPLGTTGACDSVSLGDAIENWSAYAHPAPDTSGYKFGVIDYPGYHINQSANYYDVSAATYNYITGIGAYFLHANSNIASELNKNVVFKVFDDNGGFPGNLLGSAPVTFGKIKSDVDGRYPTNVMFSSPIALPVSKIFYVSIDYSALTWSGGTRDSLAVAATLDDETTGIAYQDIQELGGWVPVNQFWVPSQNPLDVSLWIFPYLNTEASGTCESLPVHLLSFTSQRNNYDVSLKWTVADEIGMKGYEVQKSGNNGAYSTVAFIPALNNTKNQAYSIVDKNAFSSSATLQYRLKQIDGDGSVKYSRVLQVKSGSAINDVVFANPFNGALKLNVNLATSQPVSVFVYDMQGRLAASLPQKLYNASQNRLIVHGTENLKTGLYSVKIIAGSEQKIYKAMKQ